MEDFDWIFQFLGRLQPLIVHFPIGLLVVALFFELLTIGKKRSGLREGIRWMVYLGAIFAVIGAIFGWLLRTKDDYTGELVDFHQNMGVATAVLAGITALLLRLKASGKLPNILPYRSGLVLTVVCLTIAGNPKESELFRRISLSQDHDDVMPKKGAHWSDKALKIFQEALLAVSKPDLPDVRDQKHPVDQLMGAYFDENDIAWPKVVDDRTFIRRAYLDIVGLLPTTDEIKNFLSAQGPDKREKLIDTLLEDTVNYTQNWLSFWNDLLRKDYSGTGFITGGIKKGLVYGKTADERPCSSISDPVVIDQVHQSIYHPLGIPPKTECTIEGRPFYTTPDGHGKAILDLFA